MKTKIIFFKYTFVGRGLRADQFMHWLSIGHTHQRTHLTRPDLLNIQDQYLMNLRRSGKEYHREWKAEFCPVIPAN